MTSTMHILLQQGPLELFFGGLEHLQWGQKDGLARCKTFIACGCTQTTNKQLLKLRFLPFCTRGPGGEYLQDPWTRHVQGYGCV